MQVFKWLRLTLVLMCLVWGTPWKCHFHEMVIGRQLSSDYPATEATLQAVRSQMSIQHEATLQAMWAQMSIQHEATLQAVQTQARLLTAHLGSPHSEAPAVSINC